MTKHPKLNPLDKSIQAYMAEFTKIPDFENIQQNNNLKNVFLFIATKMVKLYSARQIVINNFVPAVNKMIAETRGYIKSSIYKQFILSTENHLDESREDIIRLGYVIFFHKYESFVNEYISWIETRNEDNDSSQTLIEYSKVRFDFNPLQWWKFPVVHKVNFVSNCTKHHDGKCKVKDSKHTRPKKYLQTLEGEIIKPTLKDFEDDTNELIRSVANTLIPIMSNIIMFKGAEGMVKSYENLIVTCEKSAVLYENAKNETFNHEGIDYPLYIGEQLLQQTNKAVEYRNKIDQYKIDMHEYKNKADVSLQIITSKIKQYCSDYAV